MSAPSNGGGCLSNHVSISVLAFIWTPQVLGRCTVMWKTYHTHGVLNHRDQTAPLPIEKLHTDPTDPFVPPPGCATIVPFLLNGAQTWAQRIKKTARKFSREVFGHVRDHVLLGDSGIFFEAEHKVKKTIFFFKTVSGIRWKSPCERPACDMVRSSGGHVLHDTFTRWVHMGIYTATPFQPPHSHAHRDV